MLSTKKCLLQCNTELKLSNSRERFFSKFLRMQPDVSYYDLVVLRRRNSIRMSQILQQKYKYYKDNISFAFDLRFNVKFLLILNAEINFYTKIRG